MTERGFFDRYPLFYESGNTPAGPRLNARYDCLIGRHLEEIRGTTVLDVGSHDGRWTLAALSAGAASAIGIEPRAELVAAAERNLRAYGVEGARFYVGDALETLRREKLKAETVFLFGILYHINYHVALLQELWETGAETVVIDSRVVPDEESGTGATIRLRAERIANISNAAFAVSPGTDVAIVGLPSRQAIKFLFEAFGFEVYEVPWDSYFERWDKEGLALGDYAFGQRATFVARRP